MFLIACELCIIKRSKANASVNYEVGQVSLHLSPSPQTLNTSEKQSSLRCADTPGWVPRLCPASSHPHTSLLGVGAGPEDQDNPRGALWFITNQPSQLQSCVTHPPGQIPQEGRRKAGADKILQQCGVPAAHPSKGTRWAENMGLWVDGYQGIKESLRVEKTSKIIESSHKLRAGETGSDGIS